MKLMTENFLKLINFQVIELNKIKIINRMNKIKKFKN